MFNENTTQLGGDNVFGHISFVSVDSACLPDIRLSLCILNAFCFEVANLAETDTEHHFRFGAVTALKVMKKHGLNLQLPLRSGTKPFL